MRIQPQCKIILEWRRISDDGGDERGFLVRACVSKRLTPNAGRQEYLMYVLMFSWNFVFCFVRKHFFIYVIEATVFVCPKPLPKRRMRKKHAIVVLSIARDVVIKYLDAKNFFPPKNDWWTYNSCLCQFCTKTVAQTHKPESIASCKFEPRIQQPFAISRWQNFCLADGSLPLSNHQSLSGVLFSIAARFCVCFWLW